MHASTLFRSVLFSCAFSFAACGESAPEPAPQEPSAVGAAAAPGPVAAGSGPAASVPPVVAATPADPAAPRKPNVLLISIDTLRADALQPWGAERPTSPNLSLLAAESWVFLNAFSQAGVTAPSHMSLLTSLYPTVHGVSNLSVSGKQRAAADAQHAQAIRVDPKVQTLASVLGAHGWKTAAFTGGGNVSSDLGFDQGFQEFDDEPTNGVSGNDGPWFDPTHVTQWIEAHKSEPFFLFVHTWIPHTPYLPPAPWNTAFDPDYTGSFVSSREAYDALPDADDPTLPSRLFLGIDRKSPEELAHVRALYDGDVRYADESVGRLLVALDESGAGKDTIIIVVSDHGEQFLEHGNFSHPGELWRELVHVPLIVRVPGREPKTIEAPARLLDVMPTVLDLVGVAPPPELQGRSLLPAIDGTLEDVPIISEIVTEWKYAATAKTPLRSIRSIRLGQWMYVARLVRGVRSEELYDRSTDPGETVNLAAVSRKEHLPTLQRFRELVERHQAACETLSARFVGTEADVSEETLKKIGQLGYVK